MIYAIIKAVISGILVAVASEFARRSPSFGALVASLPLVSILVVIWLWRDTSDVEAVARHMQSTFWYVLPSLPLFLLVPWLLRSGFSFYFALISGCLVTVALYALMTVFIKV